MPPSRLPDDPELRAALFADARLAPILSDPERYRAQVLLAEVVEAGPPPDAGGDGGDRPRLRRRGFRAGAEYFYPASAVKLFAAAAACAALARLARARGDRDRRGITLDTPLAFAHPPRRSSRLPSRGGAAADPPSPTPHRPRPPAGSTPAKPLRVTLHELFLVSDNDAYNRCYDLAGPDAILRWVRSNVGARAARDVRVCHRLFDEARDGDDATRLPEVWAEIEEGAWIRLESSRTQRIIPPAALTPSRRATNKRRRREGGDRGGIEKTPRDLEPSERRRPDCIGVARIEPGGARVDAPLDCSARNAAPLEALQNALAALARPDVLPLAESESESESESDEDADACTDRSGRSGDGGDGAHPGGSSDERPSGSLTLSSEHREALLAAARAFPRDAPPPLRYPEDAFPDDRGKFFLRGLARAALGGREGEDPPREGEYPFRVANKLGRAYGFSVDNAYVDWREGEGGEKGARRRAFFLAATIETNANGVVNDDRYEYEPVADAFMEHVAETVARFVGWGEAGGDVTVTEAGGT